MLNAAEQWDSHLLKEMKNTINSKNTSESVPESLDGNVTHDDILNRFKTIYESLYNSAETSSAVEDIKTRIRSLINEDSIMEVNKITGRVV